MFVFMKQTSGQVYHVTDAERGQTLAAFLRAKLGGVPWSRVQKLVRSRHVMIHGNVCTDEARRLKDGEVVKVLEAAAAPPPKPADVRIVYIDDDVVVVDKPSGITTTRHHEEASWPARRKQLQPTLDEMLPGIISRAQAGRSSRPPRGAKPGARPVEPKKPTRSGPVYPVHRIDRETSGLVVFARTVPAGRILAEQFRLHTTQRRYLAVAVGRVGEGTIMSNLVRDRGDGRRGSKNPADSGDPTEGKRAVTHVKPVEHFGDAYTLVECRLETGRTHQIRIHLAESGHPLCGERVYSAPRGTKAVDRSGAARVALHAADLGFVHPKTGDELHFESRMPPDMVRLIAQLRK